MQEIDLFECIKDNTIKLLVQVRDIDGYINVTKLCKTRNKFFKDWRRTNRSKQFLKALLLNSSILLWRFKVSSLLQS